MLISVVIPLYNEHESLPELTRWIDDVMQKNGFNYEVVYVDDGSTDGSWKVIEGLKGQYPQVRALRFRRNYGKSAGLNRGFDAAKGDIVITMDADLQDSPDEIPELVRMITEDGFDLVSGWKKKRYDPITKTIPTKLYNWAARKMSGIYLHDFNCGLKAYKQDVVKSIEVYGEMHRYIPILAKWAGFTKIGEKVVQHQERKFGVTKFGLERFINGPLDLLVITFMSRFGKRPMHFFGVYGVLMFVLGGAVSAWLIVQKVLAITNGLKVREVTEQPLFYLAILAMIIGTQLFMAGFLAEMISRSSHDRNNYQIAETID
ncbi:MAG: glycosyltransferase family 2 protein [Flavobacteriales bacterium]|nr:glycosyltransferase family 2 protein [Flavobacteriales bacterium]